MNLYLIDVSAVMHTGMNSTYYKERTYYGFPVGGIHFLAQQMCVPLMMGDEFILCFDSPNFRRKEFPKYKSGRTKNMSVILQTEAVFEKLQSCGIKCEKVDGYEADDIIDWASTVLREQYSEIIILGNDKDLCHSVRMNVRFKSISSNVNSVFHGNFEDSIVLGEKILFNTVSAYKTFCGCNSDSIPALKLENGLHGKQIYARFAQFCIENGVAGDYVKTSSPDLLRVYAKHSGLFTESDKVELERHIRLVYPAAMPAGARFEPAGFMSVDVTKFSHFLTLFNASDAFQYHEFKRAALTEDDKQYLKNLAHSYTSGEAFADRNIEYTKSRLCTSDMRLDSFSKDF